jgi:glycosyltransferase involved in cell wall biosynthesis
VLPAPERSLDILYVGVLPPLPGGASLSSAGLLSGFAAAGHRVRSLAPITAAMLAAGDGFADGHPDLGVTRFIVPHLDVAPSVPPSEDYRRTEGEAVGAALARLIAARRPDMVYIGRESFAWHVPDIVDAHGIPSVLRIAGDTTVGIDRGNYPPDQAEAYLRRMRRATRRIAPAPYMAKILRRFGIVDVDVILNAADLRHFAPAPKDPALQHRLDLADDDIVVVLPGVLKAVKRPLDIVHSARQALRYDPRLVYVVVGDGALRGDMEAGCRELGVADRFRFAGWTDYRAMPAYFNLADMVLMASEVEGLSRVYVEAQACGRTLIASDFPSVFDVVMPGENGLVFRTGDIADLTAKTLQAAADPELRAALGRNARARAVQVHDHDRAVAAHLRLFADVVAECAAVGLQAATGTSATLTP